MINLFHGECIGCRKDGTRKKSGKGHQNNHARQARVQAVTEETEESIFKQFLHT